MTTSQLSVRRVVRAAQNRFHRHVLDSAFDRKHRVNTNGVQQPSELALRGENVAHANNYEPTPINVFRRAINSLRVDYSRFVLVDMGSGKGRTLLLAAERPFLRVEGIELAGDLHEIALQNIARTDAASLHASIINHHTDATKYQIPKEPFILYLFNPFSESVIAKVLANIEMSLRAAPREGYIVYVNAEYRGLFDNKKFLKEMPRSRWARAIDRIVSPWPVVIYQTADTAAVS